ncbi:MAG TPA: putative Ig domain-containing protein [Planctomycetaceae bacterium]|nr:putative Ig domain-containing protein [Planctomycetaceae bacterium]
MNRREQILAVSCGAAVALWFGGGMVYNAVFGPITERSKQVASLTKTVSEKTDEAIAIAKARKQLREWQAVSLPPDRGAKTSKSPSALDAQRLYQAWITDLAQLSGLSDIVVKPGIRSRVVNSGGRSGRGPNVYLTVPVSFEAEARFTQLTTFLDHFQRVDLLHRINKLKVTSRESEGDPLLKITLEAEGLALIDVPWRRTLFPETTLEKPLDEDATECVIATGESFPKKTPFRVRIGSEYLTVTEANGVHWTVTREVERTHGGRHAAGSTVELCPIKPGVPSLDKTAFRDVLASNVFIQAPPPKEYKLKLGPIAEQVVIRGQKLSFAIPATGYDPTAGEPDFRLTTPGPPGLELDRGTGKLVWNPDSKQPVGKFPLKFEIKHPSAPDGKVTGDVTVVFREPNSPPVVEKLASQTVYRGQPWKLKLKVTDPETAPEKLQVKLGDNPPEGVTVNPATKEVTWTPAPTFNLGDYTVNVVVTDDGLPPQTVTTAIPVKVEDDAASFTFLVGIISRDGVQEGWLYDRSQDKKTIVKMGDEVKVADVSGQVTEIGKDYLLLKQGETQHRLDLGTNLRQMLAATTAAKPATEAPAKL